MVKPRPLSPHLQVYRPQLTSIMSIMHRASGAVLATGSLLVALWLVALAAGTAVFNPVADAMQHPLGQLVVLGYSLALVYHGLNGIRHLIWDAGFGFDLKVTKITGVLAFFGSFVLTILFYLLGKNLF